jgi:hypothetical protein
MAMGALSHQLRDIVDIVWGGGGGAAGDGAFERFGRLHSVSTY